jgi:tetratricopeptide (TPR) repeat protein
VPELWHPYSNELGDQNQLVRSVDIYSCGGWGIKIMKFGQHMGRNAWQGTRASIGLALLTASLWSGAAWAKDPFRATNVKVIGDRTSAAFVQLFERGNYQEATKLLNQAEANEPLTFALKASLIFSNLDKSVKTLPTEFLDYAQKTQTTAQAMLATDPLRGNLYLAVGQFLEGVYIYKQSGAVKGTPQVLGKVQQAFKYLDEAQKISKDDPELNLIKGYIDLFIGLNLPFSSPNQALNRLEKFAGPRYLADRGIAMGYLEMKQAAKALPAIDRALQSVPDNPELLYLKAQILRRQEDRNSVEYFNKALAKQAQLPPSLVKQITKERDRAKEKLGIK